MGDKMLHYLLVILVYAVFIGIVYTHKNKNGMGSKTSLSLPFGFYVLYLVILFSVYERILTYLILHKVDSRSSYIAVCAAGSGGYVLLFFIGTVILGMMLGAKNPDILTYMVLVIVLIINVLIVVKAANIHFDEMELMLGEKVFDDFYKTLSENRVKGQVKSLYNIKWLLMAVPAIVYLCQILRLQEIKGYQVIDISDKHRKNIIEKENET